ncbi:hemin uptake protein HemP [Nitratireductor sp. GCM10026969]
MSVRREDSVQLTINREYHGGGTLPDRTLSSIDLFRGRREIAIEHAGSLYRLKITRQGKLILNK